MLVRHPKVTLVCILILLLFSSFVYIPKVFSQEVYSLTVATSHGSPSPSVGVHIYDSGTSVTCNVSSPVIEGSTVWTCTGWTGTGSVPSSGSGVSTTFPIAQNSSITWNWVS